MRCVPQQTDADGAHSEASGRYSPHWCGRGLSARSHTSWRHTRRLSPRRCCHSSAVSSEAGSEGDLAKMRYTVEHDSMVRTVLDGNGKLKIKSDEWIFDRM